MSTASANLFEYEDTGFNLKRYATFGFIVLTHIAAIYALKSGFVTEIKMNLPKEVIVSFVSTPLNVAIKNDSRPSNTKKTTLAVPAIKPVALPDLASNAPSENAIVIAAAETPVHEKPALSTSIATASAQTTPQPSLKATSQVEYLRAPQPVYPAQSRRLREEGKVTLKVLVNEKGEAEKVDVHHSSGSQRLDEAARAALMHALFKPYVEDGKAIPMLATATINFSLAG
ncbi:energy transducer TonB [Undibacterium jejuense]|uniref:Energy transducer TonB n=1 Tax=Undibacterium jejuense TaxID=1344949 RepID=A0A923HC79_9BURK|nr:energy transducer TonB [Undibacterium jejuense]MBC3861039.1 energy transducer TonB [Undibacterium jejuense]